VNVLANDYYMRIDDFVKSNQAFNLKISVFRFEGSFALLRSSSQHNTTEDINNS
jgi:hypothetical protein